MTKISNFLQVLKEKLLVLKDKLKEKLKNKKTLAIVIASASVLLVSILTVTLILVLGGNKGTDDLSESEWPEAGVYYFDAGYDEYTLTLNPGNTFSLIYKGESASGSYTLSDGVLVLDFYAEGRETISATYENNVVTMTYMGASMRLLKKINYQVSFETNGGSAIASATVVNGKTIGKPADPTRDGYIFVGWYSDGAFKTTFEFGAQPITSDLTLYARWSEDKGNTIYNVRFDLNYEGAVNPESLATIGNKVYGLPEAVRDGYDFCGWWVSMSKDPAKLSYRLTEGMELDANTTVYALWQEKAIGSKLPAPVVNVAVGSISWADVPNARSYDVSVIGPDGEVVLSTSTSSTSVNVPFATYSEGEYEITVVANAASGGDNNSMAVRYYTNKALRSVSVFNVVGSTLVFNTIENAEKYFVTVVCGNAAHNHTNFDNGTSRVFSFSNCDMPADGIKFTVTAVAKGYASSTSEVFVYQRVLGAVENLHIDPNTEVLHWNEVEGAEYYMVSVKCSNQSHTHEYVNNGTKTYVSLKECGALEGGIVVKVYPVARGFSSPEAVEYQYDKKTLASPVGLVLSGTTLTWTSVADAIGYEILVGEEVYSANGCSYDLSALLDAAYGASIAVRVRAKGAMDSLYSDPIHVMIGEMSGIKYSESMLSWDPVIGTEYYELSINGGEIVKIENANRVAVTLTKAGVNTLKVRSVTGNVYSDWAVCEVYAHTIIFDAMGGSEIIVQYKAVGDRIELGTPTKEGYDFVDWYNVPGGPASNGLVYRDEFFVGSGSMVIYAHYTPKKYTITYNYGDGGRGDRESDEVSFEQYYQLIVPAANNPTAAFGGWFSASDGKGVQYTDSNGVSLAPWKETAGAEMFAYWIDETLAFTLSNVNGRAGYVVSAGARTALLEEITIPASYQGLPVLMIAGNAFIDCTNLKILNFPQTIEQISLIDPFAGCTNLEEVNVYSVAGITSARYWSVDGVLFDNGTASTDGVKISYMPLAKAGTYRIPESITEIPDRAFMNSGLSKIIVPTSVTRIGNNAFENCTRLTSVVFEAVRVGETAKGLAIGKRVFNGCTVLESITLPARLEDISLTKYTLSEDKIITDGVDNAFTGCLSLSSVNISAENKKFKSVDGIIYSQDGGILYYCPETKTGALTVPATTHTIAPGAFIGCSKLDEVTIPSNVTMVGECAFYGLSLTKVTFLGSGFKDVTIGKYAFRGCTELSQLVITGSRLAVLSEGAFYGCKKLSSFQIPASMTSIGKDAFRDCTALESVIFADHGKELKFGEDAFYNCTSLVRVHLPANVSTLPGIFGGCIALRELTVAEDSPYFTSVEGVLFNKDKTAIIYFPQGKTGVYTLPETVTTIANGVFRGVSGLDKIVLPNTLTMIGDEAFKSCDVGEIVFEGGTVGQSLTIGTSAFEKAKGLSQFLLPSHTKVIGDYAFSGSDIKIGRLPNGVLNVGAYAFSHSDNLTSLFIPASVTELGDHVFYMCSNLNSVTLNAGLQTIGDYAFSQVGGESRFTTIQIPATVTKIGNYAFADGNLKEITFANNSTLRTIGAHAFDGAALQTITIPKSVTEIGAYAFYSSSITSVIFEEGGTEPLTIGNEYVYTYQQNNAGAFITEIEVGYVFGNTTSLSSVVFPSRLAELRENSFRDAGSSAGFTVDFGESSALTTIGESCFMGSKLTAIVIPKSVCNLDPVVDNAFGLTYNRLGVGANAFYECEMLQTITFEGGGQAPLTIGENAFFGSKIGSILLPARLAPYICYTGQSVTGLVNGSAGLSNAGSLASIEVEEGGAYYAAKDGILYNGNLTELILCPLGKSGAVSIPASVTHIGNGAFRDCVLITELTFEGGDDDMTIGKEAFRGCEGISEIVLPANVVYLGESVFHSCTSLVTLTLPNRLQNFNGTIIENCPSLVNIVVLEGNTSIFSDGGVIYTADKKTLVYYPVNREETTYTLLPEVTIIDSSAFMGNVWLETIILPEGLREIGASAFKDCSKLISINIPSTVEVIDEDAFRNCAVLTSVTFAQQGSVAITIGNGAFAESALTKIELPGRLTALGNSVFFNSKLKEITFAQNSALTSMGDAVFQGTALMAITLPNGIISIGGYTFSGCASLISVTFGEGLLTLGDNTFGVTLDLSSYYPKVEAEASSVKRVSFPASLKTIGVNTFSGCKSIKEVTFAQGSQLEKIPTGTFYESSIETFTIPASVLEIADKDESDYNMHGAFEKADALVSITFANGSKCAKIGAKAFHLCTALTDVVIPPSVSTVGASAFKGCSALESITVPSSATQLGAGMFEECTGLKNVSLQTKATALPEKMFYGCSSLTSIVIPSGVTKLGDEIFKLSGLSSAEIENGAGGLKIIDGVFYDAALTTVITCLPENAVSRVTIPKTVTSVSSGAFSNVNTVRQVIFESGGSSSLVISDNAFSACYRLANVVLPERLTTIGAEAFFRCYDLTHITIPSTVTYIGEYAFDQCYKLVEVYNLSKLNIKAKAYNNGYVSYYARNVYTPTSGQSILNIDENGFVTANITIIDKIFADRWEEVTTTYTYLIGYMGDETELTLPAGFDAFYDYVFYNNNYITAVVIPEGAGREAMRYDVFYNCGKLSIFMKDATASLSWDRDWNCGRPVIFSYDGAEHTYVFDACGGNAIASVTSKYSVELPVPTHPDDTMIFGGWYDNPDFTGARITDTMYYSATKNTLYAKWLTPSDVVSGGTGYADAIEIGLNKTADVNIAEGGQKVYFKFTPSEPGTYHVNLTGELDHLIISVWDPLLNFKEEMSLEQPGPSLFVLS